MSDKSSYLGYLPTVLWEDDPPTPSFSLGTMLRIFEKILSGIDDGDAVTHGDHEHDGIEQVIGRLHRLFDPWTTPPEFLEWLASWVNLEFASLWDEYQRRKITSEIAQIHLRRGLKAGLLKHLGLFAVQSKRPRIVIDDCSKVLFATPMPGQIAPITSLIVQGPSVRFDRVSNSFVKAHDGLVRPLCMTIGPTTDRSLFVGDDGTPGGWTPVVGKGVWQFPPPGRYDFGGAPPKPKRIGPAGWNLDSPVALVADNAIPWNLYVLDRVSFLSPPNTPVLYSLTSPGFGACATVATYGVAGTVSPVAMARDINGHLLILDRGALPGGPAAPKVIDIQIAPLAVSTRPLANIIEPLSLLVQPNGDLIIGDGREQDHPVRGDLVRVDRANNMNWVESQLLAPLAAGLNPLVTPTAVVQKDATHLYVADVGLKPFVPPGAHPLIREIAEPAAVYLVDIGSAPPVVSLATELNQLVFPSGMVMDAGTLYICDRGEYSDPAFGGPMIRVWRARPHEFGVIVHFCGQTPILPPEQRLNAQIAQNIYDVVRTESPAHSAPQPLIPMA